MNDTMQNVIENEEGGTTFKVVWIAVLAFILGVSLTFLLVYLNKENFVRSFFIAQQNAPGYTSTPPQEIPTCLSSDIKSASDKDLVVYILKYNEAMKPRLQKLLTTLSSEKNKSLVNSVLSRQEKETVVMKTVYKNETKKEYVSANEKTTLTISMPFPDDILSQNGFSEEERISLLRGVLENIGKSYYSTTAVLTKNSVLKQNALDFNKFKNDFVKSMNSK